MARRNRNRNRNRSSRTYQDSSGAYHSSHASAAAANTRMGTNPSTGGSGGQVAGASNSNIPPGYGGASGRFADIDPGSPEGQAIIQIDNEAIEYGVPMSESGEFSRSRGNDGYIIPDGLYKGMNRSQAEKARAEHLKSISANTGYAFNTDFTSGIKKASESLNAKLRDTMSDGWLSNGSKEDQKKILTESTASQIAKLFPSLDEFNKQYNSNQEIKNAIDSFKGVGGDINSITSKITDPAITPVNVENQDLSTYLSQLNPTATPQQKKAFDLLLPERELAQAEIMQLASIPQQYKDLYFGTPEQMGLIQEKKLQAEETKKLLEKKAKADEKNLRAQAQYAIDQNNADMEIASATIEENRLNSKNYMTGMLAKLGALNTTGAAPQAIATIEQKYQAQASQLRSRVNMANRGIELKLNEALDDVDIQKEEAILDIESDLTLDREEVLKQIMKLEQSSTKEIYNILGKYAKEFRTTSEKYAKEAKAAAAKYTKELAGTLSNIDLDGLVEGSYVVKGKTKGVLRPDGTIEKLALTPTQQQDVESAGIVGADAIRFFISTEPAFRDEFIRNNLGGDRMSAPMLRQTYNEWKKAKADAKKTTTKTTTDDEVSLDDL